MFKVRGVYNNNNSILLYRSYVSMEEKCFAKENFALQNNKK